MFSGRMTMTSTKSCSDDLQRLYRLLREADAVMIGAPLARAAEAPGAGWYWGNEAHSADFPRGIRTYQGTVGSLEEVLYGPSAHTDGSANLVGALKRALATCGYTDLKSFQRIDVNVTPYVK